MDQNAPLLQTNTKTISNQKKKYKTTIFSLFAFLVLVYLKVWSMLDRVEYPPEYNLYVADVCPISQNKTFFEKHVTYRRKKLHWKTPLAIPKHPETEGKFTGNWPNNLKEMSLAERRDTACPCTNYPNQKRIERYPDVLAIGFPKCGTGTLAFFDCHSKIVFREAEASFFNTNRFNRGLRAYALPYAAKSEILIEKTPNYVKGNTTTLTRTAKNMKTTIPKLKLLVVLCDPVKRYISHQKHMLVGYSKTALSPHEADLKLIENVERDVKRLKINDYRPSAADFSLSKSISRHDDFLAYGNYFTQLYPFLKEFDLSNIHFMDGMNRDAELEAKKFEQFLGLEHELHFRANLTKGFMCLHKPLVHCLSAAKGRSSTIDVKKELEDEMAELELYFKNEMKKIFQVLSLSAEFCTNPDRFNWLTKYVCN
jgi:hypothetical protein